jgi:hypothetical protein
MKHQAELTWYFSAGQCAFEKSLFGGMLDRAALMAHGSKTCEACEGTGYSVAEVSAEIVMLSDPGVTTEPDSPQVCRKCRGRGSFPSRKLGRVSPAWRALAPAVVARGAGLVTLTARPMSAARSEPSYVPDDESMRRFARVSRKLRLMSAQQVEVLARYYGDIGSSWVLSPAGRIGAVYPMTAHGKAMIADWLRTRPEAESFIRHDEIIRTVAAVNRRATTPDDLVRRKLHKADDEARELLADAQNNWKAIR